MTRDRRDRDVKVLGPAVDGDDDRDDKVLGPEEPTRPEVGTDDDAVPCLRGTRVDRDRPPRVDGDTSLAELYAATGIAVPPPPVRDGPDPAFDALMDEVAAPPVASRAGDPRPPTDDPEASRLAASVSDPSLRASAAIDAAVAAADRVAAMTSAPPKVAPATPVAPPPPDVALAECAEILRRADRILLTSHRRPDGDGSGSMIGLSILLRTQNKNPTLYCPDLAARRYQWLPQMSSWVQRLSPTARFDCTIVVDCADESLLGGSLPGREVCGTLITLDHHASAHPFGDVMVWDPSAAAVGVLVSRLADRLGWSIGPDAATALYVSLISDTGGFRHANTNAEVLDVASRLVACGASPVAIAHSLEERSSASKIRLLGAVLSTLELHCAGRVAILTVTTEMVERCRAHWEDIEGMVNWARNVDGAMVGVMLTTAKGGGVRMSMRSRSDRIDIGAVCMRLGGGGHPGAGGGHLATELPDAKDRIVRALDAALGDARPSGRIPPHQR